MKIIRERQIGSDKTQNVFVAEVEGIGMAAAMGRRHISHQRQFNIFRQPTSDNSNGETGETIGPTRNNSHDRESRSPQERKTGRRNQHRMSIRPSYRYVGQAQNVVDPDAK